ncbi:signal peptidase I [Candidatus Babeliales bacterium]|nr:signal peptidase I [Candidatus Babeliales bacterium]
MKKSITIKKFCVITVFVVIASTVAIQLFAKPYPLLGDCMEPAFKDGQLCLVNRISPYLRQHQINDVIIFKHEEKIWISRIVALETNTIQIAEGKIIVNGAALQDGIHRIWPGWKYGSYAINTTLQVPPDHVFVLSDNLSAQHDDSRVFGPISKESIMGRVW